VQKYNRIYENAREATWDGLFLAKAITY